MKDPSLEIKLSFITGLKEAVLTELKKQKGVKILKEKDSSVYLSDQKNLEQIKELRSPTRAYLVTRNAKYHPRYLFTHKSILSSLIEKIITANQSKFKTFKISCAGSDSKEILALSDYIKKTYKLKEAEEADLKIHITKDGDIWEVGAQITLRPLSARNYKTVNIAGGMDPTIAYAMNSFCSLGKKDNYLNIFCGSATLLIEAALTFPETKELIGFDNNKKNLSAGVQNIKKAGLIKNIKLKEADIFNQPDFGKFDVITSNLPFGMSVGKDEDLLKLYKKFISYSEQALNPKGRLVVYTTQDNILKEALNQSKFKVSRKLELKINTTSGAYLYPKIFVCRFE